MADELKLNPLDLYDSPDPNVVRSRLQGPYRLSLYADSWWRVEGRTDGKHIPDALAGSWTGYIEAERAVKAALANEGKANG